MEVEAITAGRQRGGIFTSVKDLARKLLRYIRHYNKAPRPVKWKFADPRRRITTASRVTVHQVFDRLESFA